MTAAAWIKLGAGLAGLSVGLGAFAAHGLKARLSPDMLAVFETGARYQMYHALALIAVGLIAARWPSKPVAVAGCCFALGIFWFSGSLYALALTGIRKFGALTPIGGLLFLIGWAALLAAPLPKVLE